MTWGKYRSFLEREREEGRPAPDLDSKPVLFEDVQWIYDGYCQLREACECVGGLKPVAFSELVAWMDVYKLTNLDERDEFVRLIRELDRKWIDVVGARLGNAGTDNQRQTSRTRRPVSRERTRPSESGRSFGDGKH